MYFSKQTTVALLQSTAVLAATVNVKVGGNAALVFNPTSVTAQPGDTVRFQFLDLNHTATAGQPGAGCKPSGQFNSGFVPIAAGTNPGSTFDVAVTDTKPITVYCAQAVHCQSGMVMVINPTQTGATSLAAYQKVCSKAKQNIAPAAANGGTLRNVQNNAAAAKGKGKKAKGAKAAAGNQAAKGNGNGNGNGNGQAKKGAKAAAGNQAAKGNGNGQARKGAKAAAGNQAANGNGNGQAQKGAKKAARKAANQNNNQRARLVRHKI